MKVKPAAMFLVFCLIMANHVLSFAQASMEDKFEIFLESRTIIPHAKTIDQLNSALYTLSGQHVLIQFDHIPSTDEKIYLETEGIKLLAYIPNYAWFATLTATAIKPAYGIRDISNIEIIDKISPYIVENGVAARGIIDRNKARIYTAFFSDVADNEIRALLTNYGAGTKILPDAWEITLSPDRIFEFASHDIVQWVEDIPREKTTHLNTVRARIHANQVQDPPYNLHANGYVMAMWDAGAAYPHTDYASRRTVGDGSGNHFHATLVAGIAVGDGSRSQTCEGYPYQWKGIAIEAGLITYDWDNSVGEHNAAINTYNADVSQNAWGYDLCNAGLCDGFGDYDITSRSYDMVVRGLYTHKITVVGSAGNDGECTICSGSLPNYPYGTVSGPIATSKNALAVSASLANNDGWWSLSSRGPTDDGRIKPDIAAPGCKSYGGIKTTYTDNCYNSDYCGTSFASPVASGCAIILYEIYNNYYSHDPLPSTVRGILYHSALDLGNPGPDYMYGYGRVNIQDAVDIVIADMGYNKRIIENQISTSETDTFEMIIDEGATELKLTLVWDDYQATQGAGIKLINNLDLTLESPSAVIHYPWTLDWNNPGLPATTGVDSRNNIEQAFVGTPEAGIWTVYVTGTAVPAAPQRYSLIGDFSGFTYDYLPGDANMYNAVWQPSVIGSDATYLIGYFRGITTSLPCLLDGFWAAADVNGDCAVIGADVTKLVNYLRGLTDLEYCPAYEPAWLTPADLPVDPPAGWPNCE